MQLLTISLNYKRVPLVLRERLAFSEDELMQAMKMLKAEQSILENVILSTCNRTEIYAVVDHEHRGLDYLKRFLSNWFHIDLTEFETYLDIYEENRASNYLFRVACGLESLIVGEEQILAQVKTSLFSAQEVQSTGSILNHLFNQVISLSKRMHTETQLSRNSVSVGTAAVQLAKKHLSDLTEKKVLVIGAGQMSELSVKYLAKQNAEIFVVNRTYEKAVKLAETVNAKALDWSNLTEILSEVDFVFSSTASKSVILTEAQLLGISYRRENRELLLFDLAVPRDISSKAGEIPGMKLFTVDDLHEVVEENQAARAQAVLEVQEEIYKENTIFENWFSSQEALPIIADLQKMGMEIQQKSMLTIERKLSNLTEHDRKVLNKLTKSIVNQILRQPILQVKEIATAENSNEQLELFKNIFGLESEK